MQVGEDLGLKIRARGFEPSGTRLALETDNESLGQALDRDSEANSLGSEPLSPLLPSPSHPQLLKGWEVKYTDFPGKGMLTARRWEG